MGNSFCNDEANTADCNYDGGDCCGHYTNRDNCTECICYGKESCNAGISLDILGVGDGYCYDETNIVECNYDGGDCCRPNTNREHCVECICYGKESCNAGISLEFLGVGDGYCYDETNNVECNYDGGDCCLSSPNTDYCSNCTSTMCHLFGTCLAGTHPLIGNGVCNDATNIAECMFDGLDCCSGYGFGVVTTDCTECSCHGMYLIPMWIMFPTFICSTYKS